MSYNLFGGTLSLTQSVSPVVNTASPSTVVLHVCVCGIHTLLASV